MPQRARQFLLIASTLWLCWFGMMLVHESGHVIGGLCSGGTVRRVVWYPTVISRTDVQPNAPSTATTSAMRILESRSMRLEGNLDSPKVQFRREEYSIRRSMAHAILFPARTILYYRRDL